MVRFFVNLSGLRKIDVQQELAANETWGKSLRRFEENVQLEEVRFAFDQAEKLLKDTVEGTEQIVSRTNFVMTISGGALIFLGGHIGAILANKDIEHIKNVNILTFIRYHLTFIPACLLAIILLSLLLRLALHLIALDYFTIGSQPKQLFVRQYYEETNSGLPIIIEMYLGELEAYQFRITENIAKNDKHWDIINRLIFQAAFFTVATGWLLLIELCLCF